MQSIYSKEKVENDFIWRATNPMKTKCCPHCRHIQSIDLMVCPQCQTDWSTASQTSPLEEELDLLDSGETVRRPFQPSRVVLVASPSSAPSEQIHNPEHIALSDGAESFGATYEEEDPLLYKNIGAYIPTQKIGKGGFGTVYRAMHRPSQTERALKLLHLETSTSEHIVKRFQREAETIEKCTHPSIVRLEDHGFIQTHNIYYFAMELLTGDSLREHIDRGEHFSISALISLFKQLTDVLYYIHQRDIYHRDIKPSNIFLPHSTEDVQTIKLIDFGIASVQDGRTVLTSTGSFIGSPTYMSPEQAKGEARQVDQRSDLYSLALILFELLTGKRPFAADSVHGMLFNHVYTPPPYLVELSPQRTWSPVLEHFIQRALSKQPNERPEHAAFFWQECEHALLKQLDIEQQITHLPHAAPTQDLPTPTDNTQDWESVETSTDAHSHTSSSTEDASVFIESSEGTALSEPASLTDFAPPCPSIDALHVGSIHKVQRPDSVPSQSPHIKTPLKEPSFPAEVYINRLSEEDEDDTVMQPYNPNAYAVSSKTSRPFWQKAFFLGLALLIIGGTILYIAWYNTWISFGN